MRPLSAGDVAWLAVVPAALVTVLAIVLIGPFVGRDLMGTAHVRFWSKVMFEVWPEPVEHGRYVVALAAPLLLAAFTIAGLRRRFTATPAAVDLLVLAVQAALAGFVVLCFLQQRDEVLGPLYPASHGPAIRLTFFTPTTLAVAAIGTVALCWAMGDAGWRARLASWTRETRGRQLAAAVVAVAAIVVWLLPGAYTESTIGMANTQVLYHIPFPLDETFAVLDGRTPLVNYASQYGALWPYAFAAGMSLLGETIGVWDALALVATGLGMLAIFAVLRRVAGSSLRGLLLFLPVLATSFFLVQGPLDNRYEYGNYFGTFPIRYAGPSVLAWLVARHLGGGRPRRAGLLFLVAGIVALNNPDAGVPAVGATAAALLWAGGRPTRASLVRFALEAAGGLLAAVALVSALTLARAGSLPHLGLLLRFSRLFAQAGFGLFAMPTIGFHLILLMTFVGSFGVATVRALRAEPDRLLTGMLVWSGAFGLGAGAYFTGRSSPENLAAIFFPWSFALAILLVPALRSLGVEWWRRRAPVVVVACVLGFLAMACSLAQTPAPWRQLERLEQPGPRLFDPPLGQAFIALHTHRGERVAIMGILGHRVGANLGVVDVLPYANGIAMATMEMWDEAIADLRASGGRKLFVSLPTTTSQMLTELRGAGFRRVSGEEATELWVDRSGGRTG